MTDYHRLSRYNLSVTDPLKFLGLYKKLRNTPNVDWIEHVVQPSEKNRLDLISYNAYGTPRLNWVVAVAAGLDNVYDDLLAGTHVFLPPLTWVREQLKLSQG